MASGWFDILVAWRGETRGTGFIVTLWGWDLTDAVNRARADGHRVLNAWAALSTATTQRDVANRHSGYR